MAGHVFAKKRQKLDRRTGQQRLSYPFRKMITTIMSILPPYYIEKEDKGDELSRLL
jgi:hypothetical protein